MILLAFCITVLAAITTIFCEPRTSSLTWNLATIAWIITYISK